MWVIPAIDLKEGSCVRLKQGRMEEATVFSDDPTAMAKHWVAQGTQRLHLVDLDGAFAGAPVNQQAIEAIKKACPQTTLQLGGGIRTLATIESYLNMGLDYIIIGTAAVKSPEFVREASQAFPGQIIVGLDAKNSQVAVSGWAEVSNITVLELAKQFEDCGVSAIIYTDIEKDGMMQGVNLEATEQLAAAISIPVIASGGVSKLEDIKRLLPLQTQGVRGVITGRAIYEGTLDLKAAIELSKANSEER